MTSIKCAMRVCGKSSLHNSSREFCVFSKMSSASTNSVASNPLWNYFTFKLKLVCNLSIFFLVNTFALPGIRYFHDAALHLPQCVGNDVCSSKITYKLLLLIKWVERVWEARLTKMVAQIKKILNLLKMLICVNTTILSLNYPDKCNY